MVLQWCSRASHMPACCGSSSMSTTAARKLPHSFALLSQLVVLHVRPPQLMMVPCVAAALAAVAGAHSGPSSLALPSHWVRAALTPDGTRVFQLDGKNRTAQQVKVSEKGGSWSHKLVYVQATHGEAVPIWLPCCPCPATHPCTSFPECVSTPTQRFIACAHSSVQHACPGSLS
jgi:hypothetical protein